MAPPLVLSLQAAAAATRQPPIYTSPVHLQPQAALALASGGWHGRPMIPATDAAMFLALPLAPMIMAPTMVGCLQFVPMGKENFTVELDKIKKLFLRYRYIAIQRIPRHRHSALVGATLTLAARYYVLVKANIDEVPTLQLALTVCDEEVDRRRRCRGPCRSAGSSTTRTSTSPTTPTPCLPDSGALPCASGTGQNAQSTR